MSEQQHRSQIISDSSSSIPASPQTRSKRRPRSRMSVNAFLPPSLRNGHPSTPIGTSPKTSVVSDALRSPPSHFSGPRKLRKTRSIPDMYSGLGQGLTDGVAGPSTSQQPTGRTHSQSVTAADMPRLPPAPTPIVEVRPRPHQNDVFAEVMGWDYSSPSSPLDSTTSASMSFRSFLDQRQFSSLSQVSTSASLASPSPVIQNPFGSGVTFDSPSPARRQGGDDVPELGGHLATPHVLREMQSFESGMTARAAPDRSSLDKGKAPQLNLELPGSDTIPLLPLRPPLSPSPPLSPASPKVELDAASQYSDQVADAKPENRLSWETSMHTRYSTDVFDVIQTYRGLPLLDKIDPFSDSSETTVIKLSLQEDETAAPRDDPRFVIWGETLPNAPGAEKDDFLSFSQSSRTDLSSHNSGMSRRRSTKSKNSSNICPVVRISEDEGPKKVLLAATIERWIAQLTSELNYDELLIFFLTYRTYVSAVDLCQLLICRFHWALGPSVSSHDELVKRIVRVRTFVAMRYWLLTFFTVDFMPNRDLRLLFASWLNNLSRDPYLEKHRDAQTIVRKLRQVVKDCRDAHTRKAKTSPSSKRSSAVKAKPLPKPGQILGDLSSSAKFAESLRKAVATGGDDSDIDLDFLDDGGADSPTALGFPKLETGGGVNSYLNQAVQSPGSPPTRVPSAVHAVLQQPLPLTILQHGAPSVLVDTPFIQTPATLPVHSSTLSRVLVKTIGRLGRWRRVLNHSPTPPPSQLDNIDVSAFDVELNATGDLLTVRGGVEQYLKMIEQQTPPPPSNQSPTPSLPAPPHEVNGTQPPDYFDTPSGPVAGDLGDVDELGRLIPTDETIEENVAPGEVADHPALDQAEFYPRTNAMLRASAVTYDSAQSRESHGPPAPARRSWQVDVVSIDDLDLSDMSSGDEHDAPPAPPGLRKVPRRLPLRRDFEFVRRSDSVSSMGIRSHSSMASGQSSSVASTSSQEVTLGAGIHQWQVNALVDSLSDDDEEGDVDAALRRLEGQINHNQQRLKQTKVDGWVQTIRERLAAGDYGAEQPRFPSSDSESDEAPHDAVRPNGSSEPPLSRWTSRTEEVTVSVVPLSGRSSPISVRRVDGAVPIVSDAVTPVANQVTHVIPSPGPLPEGKPAVEDAVPLEILQSRVSSRPSTSSGPPPSRGPANNLSVTSPSGRFASVPLPRVRRSFIFACRAETLAQHFALIDRELFLAIKTEELVSDDWAGCPEEANVLDWSQFLKDRARWKAESRGGPKTSAVVAARGRFNLLANFVLSEVVVAHPHDRPHIVAKFIRIAYKAYCLNSFSTLAAIIAGLQSSWVTKAMGRSWGRIGVFEQRMFQDFKVFTTSQDDFKYMRLAVAAMGEAKPTMATTSTDLSMSGNLSDSQFPAKPQPPPACVPFLGIYLSQMSRYNKLPDLIDPSSPNEAVGADPISGNFEAPAHPEVFSALAPLPPSMQLEPLINVHKQRLIAGVIKSLVAGQHLASRVQYPIDKKIFQRCLRLRALDSDTLQRALGTSAT
ncbi:hypothetical protein JAAARDRAFT_314749 [Jaapia argillacea MUCL 33604]|uniref:Ras GEF n=1 Tax=Jaapia argillacea MUCL 33604 TaxID=933084 RepID=A0A067PMD3_9AGAM|nr:hypothetical protein JAAARDRAFT_314749 [Jaapia argillacea MUCL 33604]